MFSLNALNYLIDNFNFNSVLDVGSGSGGHAEMFLNHGKKVTCIDTGNSAYFKAGQSKPIFDDGIKMHVCNFSDFHSEEKYDLVWCSHILEHQKNVGIFIEKCYSLLSDTGILCITVPPLKTNIVGGHLTLWNTGLLLYNLVINRIDCSEAICFQYDYNISVIVRKKNLIDLDSLNLSYDIGDLEKLSNFFPIKVYQGFEGNINNINYR